MLDRYAIMRMARSKTRDGWSKRPHRMDVHSAESGAEALALYALQLPSCWTVLETVPAKRGLPAWMTARCQNGAASHETEFAAWRLER